MQLKLVIFLCPLIAMVVVRGHSGRLCGKKLVDVLKLVCKHRFYDPGVHGIFIARNFFVRHKSSIVDRCCFNECRYKDLTDYCFKPEVTTTTARPTTTTIQSTEAAYLMSEEKPTNHSPRVVRLFPSMVDLLTHLSQIIRREQRNRH